MTLVKEVYIKNFKCLEEINLVLNGKSVFVTGPNAAGKSSLIQAIWNALQSGERPIKPIGNHDDTAEVIVVIGDDNKEYTITLKYTEKKPTGYLSIRTPDGAKYDEPATVIKQLVGLIDFDMGKFLAGKSGKDRIEALKVALKIDTNDLDKRYKLAFEERSGINREIKTLSPIVKQFISAPIDEDILAGTVETPDIIQKQIDKINEGQSERRELESRIAAGEQKILQIDGSIKSKQAFIKDKNEQILRLQKEIESLNAEIENESMGKGGLNDCQTFLHKLKTDLQEMPDKSAEIAELTNKMAQAGSYEAREKALKQHEVNVRKLADLIATEEKLTNEITSLREQINAKFSAANVNGIKIQDDEIYYKDLPLAASQQNTAELTRIVSKIVFGANPGCKLLRMDASILDKNTFAAIVEEGEKEGFQFFIEEVDKNGEDLSIEIVEDLKHIKR